jgi:regulatory protein
MDMVLIEILNKLQKICSRQEKCSYDIMDYLIRHEIPVEYHEDIIHRLTEEHFIDDLRYAASFACDKFRLNRWGRIKIRHFLETKQLSDPVIDKALSEIHEDEYRKVLADELNRKRRSLVGDDASLQEMKIMQFSSSRGYEEEIVRDLCRYNTIE